MGVAFNIITQTAREGFFNAVYKDDANAQTDYHMPTILCKIRKLSWKESASETQYFSHTNNAMSTKSVT
jgi:hypothetical protein